MTVWTTHSVDAARSKISQVRFQLFCATLSIFIPLPAFLIVSDVTVKLLARGLQEIKFWFVKDKQHISFSHIS
jgi:hypothetical protein